MSQNSIILPTTGTVSGLTMTQDTNNALDTLNTLSSGASAPASPEAWQFWFNTTLNQLNQYDGTSWIPVWGVDSTNHRLNAPVGGGISTIASAATTDLGSVLGAVLTVSGTVTITSFGSSAQLGQIKFVTFIGSLTLTNNANITLPTSANIVTAAYDSLIARYEGSGAWRVISYTPRAVNVFSAYSSAGQSMASTTYTKIQFNVKDFDPYTQFDNATNYRFTPTQAGYYQINALVTLASINSGKGWTVGIYKNGSLNKQAATYSSAIQSLATEVDALISMNGTTDYLEVYGYNGDSTSQSLATSANASHFSAARIN